MHKKTRRNPYNQGFSAFGVKQIFTGSDTRTMPIYEYACPDCGHLNDHLQKLADAPVAACPSCGSIRYYKKISAAGFALKGTGWYVTDFKNGSPGKKPADKKDSGEAAVPAAAGDTKSSEAATTKTTNAEPSGTGATPAATPVAAPVAAASSSPAPAPASADK